MSNRAQEKKNQTIKEDWSMQERSQRRLRALLMQISLYETLALRDERILCN
ncbi:MAG: hypothetical protein ACE361_19940 [Aureliella sp.]